jgi:hypothetical protein
MEVSGRTPLPLRQLGGLTSGGAPNRFEGRSYYDRSNLLPCLPEDVVPQGGEEGMLLGLHAFNSF